MRRYRFAAANLLAGLAATALIGWAGDWPADALVTGIVVSVAGALAIAWLQR